MTRAAVDQRGHTRVSTSRWRGVLTLMVLALVVASVVTVVAETITLTTRYPQQPGQTNALGAPTTRLAPFGWDTLLTYIVDPTAPPNAPSRLLIGWSLDLTTTALPAAPVTVDARVTVNGSQENGVQHFVIDNTRPHVLGAQAIVDVPQPPTTVVQLQWQCLTPTGDPVTAGQVNTTLSVVEFK